MKKLMIVAAVAVIAGIAEAVPTAPSAGVIYDATFTLKTTVGKSAKDTQTYNLGKSGNVFWYQDPAISNNFRFAANGAVTNIIDTTNFVFKTVKGAKAPALTKAGLENDSILTILKGLSFVYNQKSDGKYCVTFKSSDPVCYRVAGTIKYAGSFYDDECLNTLIGGAPALLEDPLVAAFGAATLVDANWKVKSNKVEVYADDIVPALPLLKKDMTTPVDILDSNKGDRTLTVLSIAGHGTYGYVYNDTDDKVDYPGVTAVSGNAVGLASQPECVSCCAPNTPVNPLDCCFYIAAGQTDTAVFGTFTIKYNNSLTKKDLY